MAKLSLAEIKERLKVLKKTHKEIKLTNNGITLTKVELEALLEKYSPSTPIDKPKPEKDITETSLKDYTLFSKAPYNTEFDYGTESYSILSAVKTADLPRYLRTKDNLEDVAEVIYDILSKLYKSMEYIMLETDSPPPKNILVYIDAVQRFLNKRPDIQEVAHDEFGLAKDLSYFKDDYNHFLKQGRSPEIETIETSEEDKSLIKKKVDEAVEYKKPVIEPEIPKKMDIPSFALEIVDKYKVPGYEAHPEASLRRVRVKPVEDDPYMALFQQLEKSIMV